MSADPKREAGATLPAAPWFGVSEYNMPDGYFRRRVSHLYVSL